MELCGRKVTVMGLGHFGGGAAAARWAARQGAVVTVTDLAGPARLADALDSLAGEAIATYHLAGHREEDFRSADVVVVNPAVKPGNRYLQTAVEAGATLTSEIELLLEACPAAVVAVTGSNGKSTTAAMTAAILEADGRRTWLGGNLGGSLLDDIEQIRPDDWAVLELSSFQLWHLAKGSGFRVQGSGNTASEVRMPRIAVVTNCTRNHLDWHGTWEHYVAAKQRILSGQREGDAAVLNTADAEAARWGRLVRGRLVPLVPRDLLPPLSVPGEHNRVNAVCAATAALAAGCTPDAIRCGLEIYRPLPGRLEWIAVIDGRRFYNDTTATTPESTAAALEALAEPVWLLAGGSDKGADFGPLVEKIVTRARGAAFFGAVRRSLFDRVAAVAPSFPAAAMETLEEAFCWCWKASKRGESIVLSPASASRDQFENFRHRGEAFKETVASLAARRDLADPNDVARCREG